LTKALRDLSAQYEREQKQQAERVEDLRRQVEQLGRQVKLLARDYKQLAVTLRTHWR
jgi:uncharacterized protein HemX